MVGGALGRGVNGITLIRLLAASLVVVGHSGEFGNFGQSIVQQATGDQVSEGRLPVDVFFVLSGYLITASWSRLTPARYLWHRVLRIYPAYLVCIGLTAISAGPTYFLSHVLLVTGLDGRGEINQALWTLPIEFWCYLGVAALGVVGLLRPATVLLIFLGTWAVFAAINLWPADYITATVSWERLVTFFAAGSLSWFLRDRIPIDWRLCAAAILFLTVIATFPALNEAGGLFYVLGPIPIAYITLYAAAQIPIHLSFDLSYGTYIYGSIVLIALRDLTRSWPIYVAVSLVVTWLLAAISWRYVERPALARKRLWSRPTVPDQPLVVMS
jgi:peptidoglycan/LPS O-acetylase OafA/YrhL